MLVLPGDQLPLPQPANNATLHLHLGPGTAQTTPRDHHEDELYVARKMGLVQTSNKRRKVRDGPGEVQTRIWVDVEAKRVSIGFSSFPNSEKLTDGEGSTWPP